MRDLAFYNAGCHDPKGARHLLVLVRRLLRRVLRPIFYRQVELFQYLCDRLDGQDHRLFALQVELDRVKHRLDAIPPRLDIVDERHEALARQVQTSLALAWDHVALARRLATLEDHVASLSGTASSPSDEGDAHASILFPGLEKVAKSPTPTHDSEVRSKVC